MTDPETGKHIATGDAARPFFVRGTPYLEWWIRHGHRMATAEEMKEQPRSTGNLKPKRGKDRK